MAEDNLVIYECADRIATTARISGSSIWRKRRSPPPSIFPAKGRIGSAAVHGVSTMFVSALQIAAPLIAASTEFPATARFSSRMVADESAGGDSAIAVIIAAPGTSRQSRPRRR